MACPSGRRTSTPEEAPTSTGSRCDQNSIEPRKCEGPDWYVAERFENEASRR